MHSHRHGSAHTSVTGWYPRSLKQVALKLVWAALLVAVVAALGSLAKAQQQAAGGPWAQAATVLVTDKGGYLAGEPVVISGSGFYPDEIVTIQVTHFGGAAAFQTDLVAAADGTLTLTWSIDPADVGGPVYQVTADGKESGEIAQTAFKRVGALKTNKPGYDPGETAQITGEGFAPGEPVTVRIAGTGATTTVGTYAPVTTAADDAGRISASTSVQLPPGGSALLSVSAEGVSSGVSATSTAFVPLGFFVVEDQNVPNDQPGQKDLTMLGRDDSDPGIFKIFWNWDDTNFHGQRGDACALFDTPTSTAPTGDGLIDFVVCGQVQSGEAGSVAQTSGSPVSFTCNNTRTDRCSGPVQVPASDQDGFVVAGPWGFTSASQSGDNLVTNSDPFSTGDYAPNDTTLQVNMDRTWLAKKLPGGVLFTNVCSYPSIGSGDNTAPSDCITTPGGGYLVIKKVAIEPAPSGTLFQFTVSPVPAGESSSYPITGTDQTDPIGLSIGDATETVTETALSQWDLTSASCVLQDDTTSTGSRSGNQIAGITIQSGKTTTCTFTNTKQISQLSITKAADRSSFDTVGQTINYTIVATNNGNTTLAAVTVADPNVSSLACNPANGSSLAPKASMTCTGSHTVTQADIDAGSYLNTACVDDGAGGADRVCAGNDVEASKNPHLSITKEPGRTNFDTAGQTISYTIVATNDGNTTLAAVTVADPNVSSLACTPANGSSLAPGASLNCTATHTVTQGDIDAGHYANTACVDDGTDGASQACASKDVPGIKKPHLSIAKVADRTSYDAVGQVINYTITATNDGNMTLGVTVVDPNVSSLACTPANGFSLAPGVSMTCKGTHTITLADINAGHYANSACADDGADGADEVCAGKDIPAEQKPHLSITKAADQASYDTVDQVINYTITATNDGNVTLAAVTVVDLNVSSLSCTPANSSSLAPGASMTCTGRHTIALADIDAGKYANTACVDDGSGGAAQACASKEVPAAKKPDLSITKSANKTSFDIVGQTITYTIVATNNGNTTLGPVTITDANVSSLNCSPANGSSLAPGASMTCTGTHTVTQGDIDAGHYANSACVDDGEGGAAKECADKDVPADKKPAVSLIKADDLNPALYNHVGQVVTYTLTAKNTGNVMLHNVTVSDDPALTGFSCTPSIPVASLAPNATVVCTGTHAVTKIDLDAGSFADTGTVASDEASKTASDTVRAAPRLVVIKQVVRMFDGQGSASDFTMTVDDPGTNPPSFPGAESPGTEVVVDPGKYVVSEAGPVGYAAVYSAGCSGPIAIAETKTCIVTNTGLNATPSITVDKSVDRKNLPQEGGVVTFTVKVSNMSGITDPVTIDSLIDTVYGDLSVANDSPYKEQLTTCNLAGTVIAPGTSVTCTFTANFGAIPANATFTEHDTVTVTVHDDENSSAKASDDARVTQSPPISLTNSSLCTFDTNPGVAGRQFKRLFSQDAQSFPYYRLTATNPGQFFYNLSVSGTPGEKKKITLELPFPFVTQGAQPIHVYDGVDIVYNPDATFCFVPGNTTASIQEFVVLKDYGVRKLPGIDPEPVAYADAQGYNRHLTHTVELEITIPATGFAYVNQHLDDGLKGPKVDLNGDGTFDTLRYAKGTGDNALWPTSLGTHLGQVLIPELRTHTFKVSWPDGGGEDSVQNDNDFKKNPGVGGRLTIGSTDIGTPIEDCVVQLRNPSGTIVAAAKTDTDGFYLITWKHTGKEALYSVEIIVQPPGTTTPIVPVTQTVSLKANGVAAVDFVFNP